MIKLYGFTNESVVAQLAGQLGLSGMIVEVSRNKGGGLDLKAEFEPMPNNDEIDVKIIGSH